MTTESVCPTDRTATLLRDLPNEEPPLPERGTTIGGRYEVERRIGAGGYGQVYEARHRGTGQSVALKVFRPPMDGDHLFATKRFFHEARVTSALSHPNTVRVFDFGQEDSGLLFIAMELLTGRTLRGELKARAKRGNVYPEPEAIEIAIQVTRSLTEAHEAGLVHRDLKPDNIYLQRVASDDIVVKVLDFGIAKLGPGHMTLSSDTSVPGTPAYMAPEHALNQPVDQRTDLYSLGVILFQLVTGELPFIGSSDPQTLYKHAYEALPSLRDKARTSLSANFVRVVEKVLSKQPNDRFATARAMREALLACLEGRAPDIAEVAMRAHEEAPTEIEISNMSTPVAGTGAVPTVAPARLSDRIGLMLGALAVVISASVALWNFYGPTPTSEADPAPPAAAAPEPPPPPPPAPPPAAPPVVESRDGGAVTASQPPPPPVSKKKKKRTTRKRKRKRKPAPVEKKKKPDPLLEMRLEDLVDGESK